MSDPQKKLHSHRLQDDFDDVPELEAFDDEDDLPDLVALQKKSSPIPVNMALAPQHKIDPASPLAAIADKLILLGLVITYDLNFHLKRSHISNCARPCKAWVPELHARSDLASASFLPACVYHGEYQDVGMQYYFSNAHFFGFSDEEAIERSWALANPLRSTTKQMGPGERQAKL